MLRHRFNLDIPVRIHYKYAMHVLYERKYIKIINKTRKNQ